MDTNTPESRPDKAITRPVRVTSPDTGFVSEIFCSVQGEGLRLGERQIFFRTAGCSATCYWCDTPASKVEGSSCRVVGLEERSLPNPLTVAQAVREIESMAKAFAPVATVSFTGGEPLEQADFVASIARVIKKRKLRIYLETSGLEVDGLKKVRPFADVIAADIKLPSATGHDHWDIHRDCVKWLVGKNAFVKIVVDADTPIDEIQRAVHLIAETDRTLPLVLQPESTTLLKEGKGPEGRKALMDLVEHAQLYALRSLKDVRVIPQCHKILKVR